MNRLWVGATLAALMLGGKGAAHEFWIDPVDFWVEPGAAIAAHLRVGTEFEGVSMSYVPRNFERFDILQAEDVTQVEGRIGDRPALDMGGWSDGLAIVVHQTNEQRITWREWDRFAGFIAHKDLGDPVALQAERGLDQIDVREGYTRFAKSLIAIGAGEGADQRVGLRTEIVAALNPYTDDLSDGLPVQVWLDDLPRADVQVELFDRAPDGAVTITLHRTDEGGRVTLPVTVGHRYLVDAVVLEPDTPQAAQDPEWQTLWASLTFAVPD